MKAFIGAKIILAEPMDEITFLKTVKNQTEIPDRETRPGYHVIYPDDYHSWSPEDVFENAYREVTNGEWRIVDRERSAGTDDEKT